MAATKRELAKFLADSSMSSPIWKNKHEYPNPEDYIVKAETNGSDLFIGATAAFDQTDSDTGDIKEVTLGGDEEVLAFAMVPDTMFNKRVLEEAGSDVAKTSTFADDTVIDVLLPMPGMVLEGKLAASNALSVGSHLAPAASGEVKAFDTGTPDAAECDLGRSLTRVESGTGNTYITWRVGA